MKGRVAAENAFKQYIKPFGWLHSLFTLAKEKVFTINGMNEIDSVKNTNLYKILTYLSWQNAKGDYDGSVQEAIHSEKIK